MSTDRFDESFRQKWFEDKQYKIDVRLRKLVDKILRLVPGSKGGSRPEAVVEPCRQAGRAGVSPEASLVGYGSTVCAGQG